MTETYFTPLKETMHTVSSGLLIPTITILLFLLALSVFELGGVLVEAIAVRRTMKVNVRELINGFQKLDIDEIMAQIERSRMFRRHKSVLVELIEHRNLSAASLQALARRLLTNEELRYERITNRTDLVTRLGPMLGLMATLIPLGPGLIALGEGDTKTLADSLLTAFDATVTGLAAGGLAYAVSRLRKRWYEDYLSTLEVLMESLMEVFAHRRRIEEQKALEV
ncbi:MotA/TolQ/ExbB proton channel family protein [Sporotomaculum syntrophicum]|uniref:MotA/TolQ/ExbB proton channel family protein n=1 Tax=Sporotomaculum syntrophicum TaxID=182264 RepID=A0A9D3AWR0_9FIRM|nr:MotA/TolQ/ExbB proton channel family protein [Sporotomaculum syntrophicum]KAF1085780.1 MotA/TolQ/ExbB proton channel family protein [Sporotomaculum syntrophicum]